MQWKRLDYKGPPWNHTNYSPAIKKYIAHIEKKIQMGLQTPPYHTSDFARII